MKEFKNFSIRYTRPFFTHFKKHFCPSCGEILHIVRESKIAGPQSKEFREFDFYTTECIKVNWTEFRCFKCKKNYSINEIRNFERTQKKKKH